MTFRTFSVSYAVVGFPTAFFHSLSEDSHAKKGHRRQARKSDNTTTRIIKMIWNEKEKIKRKKKKEEEQQQKQNTNNININNNTNNEYNNNTNDEHNKGEYKEF